jgi:GT2 family glycosyltransferase
VIGSLTVSLIILTVGRKAIVNESLHANLKSANYPITELIHVDNGSGPEFTDWFKKEFNPDIQIIHKTNQGVAKGYNRGMLLASSSHLVITGCDRIMPQGWLKAWVDALQAIPYTGAISCYSNVQNNYDERYGGPVENINGINIRKAMVCAARICSKDFVFKTGFLREDFGLYGYEDCEFVDRCQRVANENGLINYILPDLGFSVHLPGDGNSEYEKFKKNQLTENKARLAKKCFELGSPYYNCYARFEENLLESI